MAAFTVIDHTELGAAASSWTKTSIPSSYDHLCIKVSSRNDTAAWMYNNKLRIHTAAGEISANYTETQLTANSATPASARTAATAEWYLFYSPAASNTADTFSSTTIWLPNYSDGNNYKQVLISNSVEGATTTDAQWRETLVAGLCSDTTAAVTGITMYAYSGNFVQYSTFTLYGVTGA